MSRWYVGALVTAAAISWIASRFHIAGLAPIGLLSIAVGLALGASLSAIAAMLRISGRLRLIIGTLILALATALAQHAWLYLDFRRQWQEARVNTPEVALFRPKSPWSPTEYFTRELTANKAALWALDAALITAASVGAFVFWQRHKNRFAQSADPNGTEHDTPQSPLRTPHSP